MLRHINMGFLGAKLLMKIRQNKDQRNQQCCLFTICFLKNQMHYQKISFFFLVFLSVLAFITISLLQRKNEFPIFHLKFRCWRASLRGFIALLTLKIHNCRFENLVTLPLYEVLLLYWPYRYKIADLKICLYLRLHININMPKISHYNIFYILRYALVRYVKCLFTNIQKQ